MADEELRDKLASNLSEICFCAGPTCSGCESNTQKIFKAGRDMARANELRNHKWDTSEYVKLSSYEQERDQLNAEILGLQKLNEIQKTYLQAAESYEKKLKAQCEKLAEALKEYQVTERDLAATTLASLSLSSS